MCKIKPEYVLNVFYVLAAFFFNLVYLNILGIHQKLYPCNYSQTSNLHPILEYPTCYFSSLFILAEVTIEQHINKFLYCTKKTFLNIKLVDKDEVQLSSAYITVKRIPLHTLQANSTYLPEEELQKYIKCVLFTYIFSQLNLWTK